MYTCELYSHGSAGMKSSAICATSTSTKSRRKKIIVDPLLQRHPQDEKAQRQVLAAPGRPVHARGNSSQFQSIIPRETHLQLLKYKLSDQASNQPVLIENSGPKVA